MKRDYDRGKFPTPIIAIIVAVIAVAVILIAVFVYLSSTNPYYGYGNGYYGGYGMMGGFGGIWMIFMMPIGLIVLVVIGYAIWRGFGWGGDRYRHSSSYRENGNAMEILRQRYARGEITQQQFDQMKKDLIG